MMNEMSYLITPLTTGFLLGAIFFGVLWWTVRKGLASERPVIWFFGSMLLRTSIIMTGFFWIARGCREGVLVCIFGFLMARLLVIRLTGAKNDIFSSQEGNYAP